MANTLDERFLNKENFYLAFKRLRHYLFQNNEWYDPIEISSYEANLETNLKKLIKAIESDCYKTKPIEPLPFPKKNQNGEDVIRPYFKISIDDQLVWIAIVNVIGKYLEDEMPNWSYGNRLFRPVWFEDKGNNKVIKFGSFHNSSPNLYRKWNQSWPLFRRYISITIKSMGYGKKFDTSKLDNDEELLYQQAKQNPKLYEYINYKYYSNPNDVYWVGLDFTKFFPSIKTDIIINNIKKHLLKDKESKTPRDDISKIMSIIPKMFVFDINKNGWSKKDLEKINLATVNKFDGLPTGLLVSGFLANVALIEVDKELMSHCYNNKIAIFKYVDDHIILSKNKKKLNEFLKFYHELLIKNKIGISFNKDKIIPLGSYNYNESKGFEVGDIDNILDINFPTPLMTQSLKKMSMLGQTDFELMNDKELKVAQLDIEHFLLADFAETEVKNETRVAFAVMKLCQLSKRYSINYSRIKTHLLQYQEYVSESNRENISDEKFIEINKKIFNEISIIKKLLTEELDKLKKVQEETFMLILNSARKNPDKLKLWKRCVQFCFQNGLNKFNEINNNIKQSEINDISKLYIKAFCLTIINEQLLSLNNKENKKFLDDVYADEIKNFFSEEIGFASDIANYENNFLMSTLINFKIIKDYVCTQKSVLKTIFIDTKCTENQEYSLVESFNKYKNGNSSFEKFLWFILDKDNNLERKIKFWKDNLDYININNIISWSIYSMFPAELSVSKILEIESYKSDDIIHESFYKKDQFDGVILYEIFKKNKDLYNKVTSNNDYQLKTFNTNYSEYIPLDIWLEKVVKEHIDKTIIDLRLSEWSFLEIIRQLSCLILDYRKNKGNIYSSFLLTFHPANFLVPVKWYKLEKNEMTWSNWKEIVEKNQIVMQNNEEYLIHDYRYLPLNSLWESLGINYLDIASIVALSVLMIKLLSKSFDWPSTANKLTFFDQLFSKAMYAIEYEPISSDTRHLLASIFSKSNLSVLYAENISFEINGKNDVDINVFIDEVVKIQENLAQNHISLRNNEPRQLTIIDIDKLNDSKGVF